MGVVTLLVLPVISEDVIGSVGGTVGTIGVVGIDVFRVDAIDVVGVGDVGEMSTKVESVDWGCILETGVMEAFAVIDCGSPIIEFGTVVDVVVAVLGCEDPNIGHTKPFFSKFIIRSSLR